MKARGCGRLAIAVTALVVLLASCESSGGESALPPPKLGDSPPIIYGSFSDLPVSGSGWIWGDGINAICQQWHVAIFDQAAWFYGTDWPWTTADVYLLKEPADPLSVNVAENFPYVKDRFIAYEGDTVFFRGRNGYFGAWSIDEISGGQANPVMNGTWYFKRDGGGDFTQETGPAEDPLREGLCNF